MATLGDVLRGLGSVLNPQVNAEVEAEARQREQQRQTIESLLLSRALAEAGPEGQMKQLALKRQRGREMFFQTPEAQAMIAKGDIRGLTTRLIGANLVDDPIKALDEARKMITSGQRVVAPGSSIVDEAGNIVTTVPERTKNQRTAWIGVPGNKKQQAVIDEQGNITQLLGVPVDAASVNVYSGPTAGVDAQGNPVFFQPSSREGTSPRIVPGIRPPETTAARKTRETAEENAATVESVERRIAEMSRQLQQQTGIVGPAGVARRVGEAAAGVVAPGVETPAIDYQNNLRLLLADVRKIVEKDPNLSNEERRNLHETLGGGIMQTPGSALRTLNNVLEYVKSKKVTGPSRGARMGQQPDEGAKGVSRSGRAMIFRGGRWEYD